MQPAPQWGSFVWRQFRCVDLNEHYLRKLKVFHETERIIRKSDSWVGSGKIMVVCTISLLKPATIRQVLRRMKSDASVRRAAFKEVARNPRLQRNLLDILSKHPGQQRIFITELTKNAQCRRMILKIAGPATR